MVAGSRFLLTVIFPEPHTNMTLIVPILTSLPNCRVYCTVSGIAAFTWTCPGYALCMRKSLEVTRIAGACSTECLTDVSGVPITRKGFTGLRKFRQLPRLRSLIPWKFLNPGFMNPVRVPLPSAEFQDYMMNACESEKIRLPEKPSDFSSIPYTGKWPNRWVNLDTLIQSTRH